MKVEEELDQFLQKIVNHMPLTAEQKQDLNDHIDVAFGRKQREEDGTATLTKNEADKTVEKDNG